MWLLIALVFYVMPDDVEKHVLTHAGILETYKTQAECESERDRIDKAMHTSYPDDEYGWTLFCKVAETKI